MLLKLVKRKSMAFALVASAMKIIFQANQAREATTTLP